MKSLGLMRLALCTMSISLYLSAQANPAPRDKEVTIYNANALIEQITIHVFDTAEWGPHKAKPRKYTKKMRAENQWTVQFEKGWPYNVIIQIETKQYRYSCQLPLIITDDYGSESYHYLDDYTNDILIIANGEKLEVYLADDHNQVKLPVTRTAKNRQANANKE